MGFPAHSVVQTGYTTPTLRFSGYTKPPHGCNVTYICFLDDVCISAHELLHCIYMFIQAYTSQFVALVMFALVMSEDRVSMQPRRQQIIEGLRKLPGTQ